MNTPIKVFHLLFIIIVQSVTCFPQFSLPFVSLNNNRNEPQRNHWNLRVSNPISGFGFNNNNRRQYDNPYIKSEVQNNNNLEKIETVTPHSVYYDKIHLPVNIVPQLPQFTRTWGYKDGKETTLKPTIQATTYHPSLWSFGNKHNSVQYNPKEKSKEDNDNKLSNENPENDFKISDDVLNDIFNNNEATTETSDYTTESTTEYTTEDLSGLNRSGVNGHVVATLLG